MWQVPLELSPLRSLADLMKTKLIKQHCTSPFLSVSVCLCLSLSVWQILSQVSCVSAAAVSECHLSQHASSLRQSLSLLSNASLQIAFLYVRPFNTPVWLKMYGKRKVRPSKSPKNLSRKYPVKWEKLATLTVHAGERRRLEKHCEFNLIHMLAPTTKTKRLQRNVTYNRSIELVLIPTENGTTELYGVQLRSNYF